MDALDQLLTFRPTNVVMRLGARSRVPLLNPLDLVAALGRGAPLACMPVLRRPALPGLLRAARFHEAALGLALPHPLAERTAPERFVAAVRGAVEEVEHALPLFLQAGPVPVRRVDPSLEAGIYRCVEAGFTLLSLDVRSLGEDAAAAVGALAGPVLERELALEVALPLTAPPPAPDALRAHLDALAARRVLPQFLRVDARAVSADGRVEPEWVEPLRQAGGEYGARLTGAGDESAGQEEVAAWLQAGVGKVEPSGPLTRAALAVMPPGEQVALAQRAAGLGLSVAELLVLLEERLPALPEAEALRLEARTFSEAEHLLEVLGLAGSGHRVLEALARGGR